MRRISRYTRNLHMKARDRDNDNTTLNHDSETLGCHKGRVGINFYYILNHIYIYIYISNIIINIIICLRFMKI